MTVVCAPIVKRNYLVSMHINELKGLFDCTIDFDGPLVAIMGVNGIGKSTIIHALACSFRPVTPSINKSKFFEFFPPTNNKSWKNSSFSLKILNKSVEKKTNDEGQLSSVDYCKASDRWKPRYDRQPLLDVYYIGIDTCCPEIERFKNRNATFTSTERNDRVSSKIVEYASVILNKNYDCILDNDFNRKNYLGVRTKDNIQYSSLSMGAGEQRVFKVLNTLVTAQPYSLVLIDEIDLLLHSDALKRMIKTMHEIALSKHLQIVFTTHSLVMNELKKYVKIKFLDKAFNKNVVYNDITSSAWHMLDGSHVRPIKVFVEDDFATTIVRSIAKDLQVNGKIDVCKYGAAKNAFTVASSMIITSENVDNTLIVLDGDEYREEAEKENQIKVSLTGNEVDADKKRNSALKLITQFSLPADKSPEEFVFDLLTRNTRMCEIVSCARNIKAVSDSHEWIYRIIVETNCTYSDIIELCKEADPDAWERYTNSVKSWINDRIDL